MTRRRMTSWYNPVLLVQTGIRVAISTIFGQFADRREAMAATNAIAQQPFDTSFNYADPEAKADLWFDYGADTGDGWDSTFAVARLLAAETIAPAGAAALPRGRLLILGGDQVYPTASREAYGERLLGPLEEAARLAAAEASWPEPKPDLYVLPGNHDWYDGLASFFGLFCRRSIGGHGLATDRPGRLIGGWQTQQTRSYFAIRLAEKWWLWGTDAQLGGYIDQPQVDFFRHVAAHWMEEDSRLILCVGDPAWASADRDAPDQRFSRFTYLESLAASIGRGHELKLVLTGDSHHYARFEQGGRHYITCGGGGAFLHPTHQLKPKALTAKAGSAEGVLEFAGERRFEIGEKADTGGEALYPSRATSWRLTLANIAFPVLNPLFTLTLFVLYLAFNWMLDVNARIVHGNSLVDVLLASRGATGGNGEQIKDLSWAYFELLLVSPSTLMMMGLALLGYYYFADFPHHRLKRFLLGVTHWAAQTALAVLVTWLALGAIADQWDPALKAIQGEAPDLARLLDGKRMLVSLVLATAAAAYASATLFGLYLILCLAFGKHANEAFSSLRIADFKSFLRLRIDAKGALHIYAVALDSVPKSRRHARDPLSDMSPHLIERVEID